MQVITNHIIKAFNGTKRLESILVEDRATGEEKEWRYDGVFIFVSMAPNTDLVKEMVESDRMGFVLTNSSLMTTVPGLFAAGDVRSGSTKQAASAAGEGAAVAIMVRNYLQQTV